MVLPISPHLWSGLATSPPSDPASSSALGSLAMTPPITAFLPASIPSGGHLNLSKQKRELRKTNLQGHSAEWINLLSPVTYSSLSSSSPSDAPPLPGKIIPPRSGGVAFSTSDSKLLSFGGYAEVESSPESIAAGGMPMERFVVNDLWEFLPFREDSPSSWGWKKIKQNDERASSYIPGPRLATALAVVPDAKYPDDTNDLAVLLGGWDPQIPGTGGVILEDVSILNVDSMKWFQPGAVAGSSKNKAIIPGGPTSRHIAVPIRLTDSDVEKNRVLLHNHRCEDHVLLMSTVPSETSDSDTIDENDTPDNNISIKWTQQITQGNCPSSRGLHCASQLDSSSGHTKGVVIFGGAAKDGNMSNEAFVLDVKTWKWAKLNCTPDDERENNNSEGNEGGIPSPRAGACLCPLNENAVLLFGGAERCEEGLRGLNDVWILSVDMETGKGSWKCLIPSGGGGDSSDEASCPPGRNAASLTRIDPKILLPKNVWEKSADDSFYALQGGWYPFQKTYNDVFVLKVLSSTE